MWDVSRRWLGDLCGAVRRGWGQECQGDPLRAWLVAGATQGWAGGPVGDLSPQEVAPVLGAFPLVQNQALGHAPLWPAGGPCHPVPGFSHGFRRHLEGLGFPRAVQGPAARRSQGDPTGRVITSTWWLRVGLGWLLQPGDQPRPHPWHVGVKPPQVLWCFLASVCPAPLW